VAGCGGGDGGSGRSAVDKAVQRWADATRAFDGQFTGCGRRVAPIHGVFSACMRTPPLDYKPAAAGLRRAFEARASCKQEAAEAGRVLVRDVSLMDQEIALSDRLVDAAIARRRLRGPAPADFEARAQRTISGDVIELRKLSGC
jgi:hypothetical protein